MKDKIITVLFIFFLLFAIYGYDQIKVKNGEIGPIGKVIKFIGLDKAQPKSKIVQKGLNTTFQYRAPDRFAELNKRLEYVDEQLKKNIIRS